MAANAPATATYTEAPVSVTLKAITPGGFDVLLTMRGVDGAEVMPKLLKTLTWLTEQGFTPTTRASNGHGAPASNAPTCPTHGQAMKQSQHGGWFCPVKIADDDGTGKPVYCKCKAK